MTAQDPELSAALGWPGGTSDPVLDRKTLLQMVAALRLASKQALEALYQAREFTELYDTEHAAAVNERCHENITALRAALAQQAEPVEPVEPVDEFIYYLVKFAQEQERERIIKFLQEMQRSVGDAHNHYGVAAVRIKEGV